LIGLVSSYMRLLDHTQRRTTVGRTPLDEWPVHRRYLYLTTHTTLTTGKLPCPRWDFEPTIWAGERPQTYVLDRAAPGTGTEKISHSLSIARPLKLGHHAPSKRVYMFTIHHGITSQNSWIVIDGAPIYMLHSTGFFSHISLELRKVWINVVEYKPNLFSTLLYRILPSHHALRYSVWVHV
jgi:hypothetical protein